MFISVIIFLTKLRQKVGGDMTLGERLRMERERRDWSQQNVAKMVEKTNAVISHYERNTRTPDPETLRNLAEIYDVTSDYLLGLEKLPMNNPSEEQVNTFKVRLRELRVKSGLSYEQLANLINESVGYIDYLENETKKLPNVNILFQLAQVLDTSIDYISGYGIDGGERLENLIELDKFLVKKEVLFDGVKLSDKSREKALNVLKVIFADYKDSKK